METDDISKFILGIVGAGIVLVVGLIILGSLTTTVGDDISTTLITNESVTFTNATQKALSYTNCYTLSCSAVYNDSANSDLIPSADYSCSTSGITITTGLNYTTPAYVDYSCKEKSTAYNSSISYIEKMATIPTWIGILIVVAMAFLILGYFYRKD